MLVIGIGNVLMQDDGIGVYLAEDLMNENEDMQIRFVAGETDVDYCLAEAEETDFLIVIDAVQLDCEKGSVCELELSQLIMMERGIAAHNYHFFHEIAGKKGWLIGIEPFRLDFSLGLSNEMKEQYQRIKEQVKEKISSILNEASLESPD